MSKLDRIRIKGFKSIKELDIPLGDINILIGANGAGKSNFISFLKMLNNIVNKKLQSFVGKQSRKADSLLYYGRKITEQIAGYLEFGSNIYFFCLKPTENNSLIFSEEMPLWKIDESNEKFAFKKSGHEETYLFDDVKEKNKPYCISQYVINSLKSWIVYHFHDTSDTALVKQAHDIKDNEKLRPDAANLAPFLYLLKEKYPDNYNQIVSTIQLVAPFFEDFKLRPDPFTLSDIQLEWSEKDSDAYFNAYSLSDGTLRFICLTTLLLQPNPPETIIIDEPELGLHPYAISVLASMIQSTSIKSQIIVSTQSVSLVNEFEPKDIIVVNRKDKQSEFKRLDEEEIKEWLEDYSLSLGELWEKNILGGRP